MPTCRTASVFATLVLAHATASEAVETCADYRRYVFKNGEQVDLATFSSSIQEGFNVTMVDEDKEVYYIRDLVTSTEADELAGFCSETEGRWVRSPMRKKSGDSGVEEEGARTSTSCPLLFAYFYMPLIEQLKAKSPSMLRELELTWALSERAAKLLQVEPSQVEPLQVIHYEAGQFYKPHHDHAGYYLSDAPSGDGPEGSPEEEAARQPPPSGESRPATILVFLSDVAGGGELNFPTLGLSFTPAKGDAVAWSNVNVKGLADPAMVHEGKPPTTGVKVAANIWIRDKPFTDIRELNSNGFKTGR